MRALFFLFLQGMLISLLSFAQQDDLTIQTKLTNGGGGCGSGLNCPNLPIVTGGSGVISFDAAVQNCSIGQNCGFGVGSWFTANGVTYTDFAGVLKFRFTRSCGPGHTCYHYQLTGMFNVHDHTSQSIVINSESGGRTITDTGGSVVLK